MNNPSANPSIEHAAGAMRGFLRQDGRKGIRNFVVVAYLVECAHHVAPSSRSPTRWTARS